MKDYLSLGPTPAAEDCCNIDDPVTAKKECRAFINQLIRQFGPGCIQNRFVIKSNPHDFGNYLDVVVEYDDACRESIEFAFKVEGEAKEYWDAEAKEELKNL